MMKAIVFNCLSLFAQDLGDKKKAKELKQREQWFKVEKIGSIASLNEL